MKTTYVVNLFAGPGAGKSTLAAEAFAVLKHRGESVELVREYVKDWAWRGEPVKRWDGLYLLAKQLRRESALYGKVEVIITDSPMFMTAVYENTYQNNSKMLLNTAMDLILQQWNEHIQHINCLVLREKQYAREGRYESEDQARKIDELCKEMVPGLHPVSNVTDIINVLRCERGY